MPLSFFNKIFKKDELLLLKNISLSIEDGDVSMFKKNIKILNNINPQLINRVDEDNNSLLKKIIINNQLDYLDFLLKNINNINFNIKDDAGLTPVFYSVINNNIETFNLLTNTGFIDFSHKDDFGQNILYYAIQSKNIYIITKLINLGIEQEYKNSTIPPPLFYISHNWDAIQDIKRFLDKTSLNYLVCDKDGNTLLHKAAIVKNNDIIIKLLSLKKWDINKKNNNNETILDIAIKKNNTDLIHFLLNNRKDLNFYSKDTDKNNSVHNAIIYTDDKICLSIVKYSLVKYINNENNKKETEFTLAARYKRYETLFYMINNFDINFEHRIIGTGNALFHLLRHKNNILATRIIKMGANVNHQIDKKYNLLQYFTERNNINAVKLLLKHNANQNSSKVIPTHKFITPLEIAVQKNNLDMVDLLVLKNLYKQKTPTNNSLLHIAIKNNNLIIVKRLIASGLNPNIKDKNGTTPLIYSISLGYYHITEYLVSRITIKELNKEDADNLTPLQYSIKNNDHIAFSLISKYCNIKQINSFGQTALHTAIYYKKINFIKNLIYRGILIRNKKSILVENILPAVLQDAVCYCAAYGDSESLDFLLSQGGDINGGKLSYEPPLHLAIKLKNNDTLHYLLNKNKIDINITSMLSGYTPIYSAIKLENIYAIKELLIRHADIHKPSGFNKETAYELIKKEETSDKAKYVFLAYK